MEEKIVKIVVAKLRKYEGEPINQEKLEAIRSAVYSATKTNKSASFSNVKKWIKAARGMMKKEEKAEKKAGRKAQKGKSSISPAEKVEHFREPHIPEVNKRVEDSVNFIKDDVVPVSPLQEVAMSRPTIVFDKVYLQSIKFEVAGIRQTMERVSRQLDKLEKELVSHAKDD